MRLLKHKTNKVYVLDGVEVLRHRYIREALDSHRIGYYRTWRCLAGILTALKDNLLLAAFRNITS